MILRNKGVYFISRDEKGEFHGHGILWASYEAKHFVGPDLGPICLQKLVTCLSADNYATYRLTYVYQESTCVFLEQPQFTY